jgi:hypothetical protein
MGLLLLDDSETVQKTVSEFRAGDANAGSFLEFFGDVDVLPYIAQDMFTGNTYTGAKGTPSQRGLATAISLRILKRSTSLSPETTTWAKTVLQELSPGDLASESKAENLMQQWWLHNGPLLMAHRENEANWLPPTVSADISDVSTASSPSEAEISVEQETLPPAQVKRPVTRIIASTFTEGDPDTISNIIVPIILIVATVGMAYCFFHILNFKKDVRTKR